jgi:putative RNA 2'-phosphotransferase
MTGSIAPVLLAGWADATLTAVDDVRLSKFLSLVLRHDPAVIGVSLDSAGWIDIDELAAAFRRRGHDITTEAIERVVIGNDKRRFTLDEVTRRIRANQGHSIPVDLGLSPRRPPAILFHGTARRKVDQILSQGLHRAARHAVHLSPDVVTAAQVGARRGPHAVLRVDAEAMYAAGHEFQLSDNGVWLVAAVPAAYLSTHTPD